MGPEGEERPSSGAKIKGIFSKEGVSRHCFQVRVSLHAKVSGEGEGALGNVLIPEVRRGIQIFPFFLLSFPVCHEGHTQETGKGAMESDIP